MDDARLNDRIGHTAVIASGGAIWQQRPLDPIYPLDFFDAIRVKIRDEGMVRNKAIPITLSVPSDSAKEGLSLWLERIEGDKFWLLTTQEILTLPRLGARAGTVARRCHHHEHLWTHPLAHHVSILTTNGDSYRLKQSTGRRPAAARAEQNQASDAIADPDTGESPHHHRPYFY